MERAPSTPDDGPDGRGLRFEHRNDARRRVQLADRITEDALQLLFTARQDIAEGPRDPVLERAQFRVLDAISVLRAVAGDLRQPELRDDEPTPTSVTGEVFARHRRAHAVRREQWLRDRKQWLEDQERRRGARPGQPRM